MQVGEADADHAVCIRAELDNVTPRTVFIVDRDHPGADAFAQASAALAAASMVLKDVAGQENLTETCLQHAKTMYGVAGEMKAIHSDSIPESAKTYKSDSWLTFTFYSAAWLHMATGDNAYLTVRSCPQLGCNSFDEHVRSVAAWSAGPDLGLAASASKRKM